VSTLVIHPGALGDVLLAVPALRALRRPPRGERLVLAAQPRIGRLLTTLGVVDEWRDFETLGLSSLFVEGARSPAVLADAAAVVCWFAAGDPIFARRLREAAPSALVASPAGRGDLPVWRHLLATVDAADGPWCEPVRVPGETAAEGRALLTGAGWDGRTPLLLVHPGAGGLTKRWPIPGFARVVGTLASGRSLALAALEGPAEPGVAEALAARLEAPLIVVREPSLCRLAGVLSWARVWLGNDSGLSHLAAALGVPALVLFDAAKLAWRPWNATTRIRVKTPAEVVDADVDAVLADLQALLG
jgi:ADP-heptose:LPS heptosyltransferase